MNELIYFGSATIITIIIIVIGLKLNIGVNE